MTRPVVSQEEPLLRGLSNGPREDLSQFRQE